MMGVVVVGIDGSDGAEAALRYAIEEAKRRSWGLRVVRAWRVPSMAYALLGPGVEPPDETEESAAKSLLDEAVRRLDSGEGVNIERMIVKGWAADALIQAATPEDILVVGCRTSKRRSRGVHGAIGEECIRNAPCPVIVVPPGERGAT
jgi:nucleotide-binding universal stress UspA family protein